MRHELRGGGGPSFAGSAGYCVRYPVSTIAVRGRWPGYVTPEVVWVRGEGLPPTIGGLHLQTADDWRHRAVVPNTLA